MKVTFEGTDFEFDLEDITVAQAKVIKVHRGLTMLGLQNGIGEGDPDALAALYWLMHAQSGIQCNPDNVDFKLLAFTKALSEAMTAGKEDADSDAAGEETPKDE